MTEDRKSNLSAPTLSPAASAIGPARMQDIAIEVDRLCSAVRRSRSAITFNNEPSQFSIMLQRKAR